MKGSKANMEPERIWGILSRTLLHMAAVNGGQRSERQELNLAKLYLVDVQPLSVIIISRLPPIIASPPADSRHAYKIHDCWTSPSCSLDIDTWK